MGGTKVVTKSSAKRPAHHASASNKPLTKREVKRASVSPKPRIIKESPLPASITSTSKASDQSTAATSLTSSLTQTPNDAGYWKSLMWFLVSLLGVLAVSGGAVWFRSKQLASVVPQPVTTQPSNTETMTKAISPLTGLTTESTAAQQRPWAVVVENFPSTRPQSGLSAADIVFEAPTEGGITRHLAIFQSHLPELLGPVRSARPYFNALARSFGAFYSHSGGSAEALQQLTNGYGKLTDVNEFFNEQAYARDSSKKAPHNLFTSGERFMSYAQKHNWQTTTSTEAMSFTATLPPGQEVLRIEVPYIPQEYSVAYEYSPARGTYMRLVDGTTLADATTNQQISVTNVILMYTDVTPVPKDPLLKMNIRTTGTGEAMLFTGGRSYRGIWEFNDPDKPIKWLDAEGNPLPLQPGNTWISILDESAFQEPTNTVPELTP